MRAHFIMQFPAEADQLVPRPHRPALVPLGKTVRCVAGSASGASLPMCHLMGLKLFAHDCLMNARATYALLRVSSSQVPVYTLFDLLPCKLLAFTF